MLVEAIEYPLEGDAPFETLAVGGGLYLLSFLLVPAVLLGGYTVAVSRSLLAGRREPPAFGDWRRLFVDGLAVAGIALAYSAPGIVLGVVGVGLLALLGTLPAGTGAEALATVVGGAGLLAAPAYLLAVGYALPAGVVNYARTDELSAAWDRSTMATVLTDGSYLKAWLLGATALTVAGSGGGPLVWVLVGFLVLFYGQVAATHAFTTGTMDALGLSPEPPEAESAERTEEAASDSGDDRAKATERAMAASGRATPADERRAATEEDDPDGTWPGIEGVAGVDGSTASTLRAAGYETAADLREATRRELAELDGVGPVLADRIKRDVGD